jgi:hypothetical protein
MSELDNEYRRANDRRQALYAELTDIAEWWVAEMQSLLSKSALHERYLVRQWKDEHHGRLWFSIGILRAATLHLWSDAKPVGMDRVILQLSASYLVSETKITALLNALTGGFDLQRKTSWLPLSEKDNEEIKAALIEWVISDSFAH